VIAVTLSPVTVHRTNCNSIITVYLDLTVDPPQYICAHEWNSSPPVSDCGDAPFLHDTQPKTVARVMIWHGPPNAGEKNVSIECSRFSFMDFDGSNFRADPVLCDLWRRIALAGARSELSDLRWLNDPQLDAVPFPADDTRTATIVVRP
jgi:hypothetical protein